MKRKKTIVIGLDGGLIQWIKGIPADIRIVVRDYDVEGADPEGLSHDEDGQECFTTFWEKEDEGA